ncbi:MAG: hypothetical protein C5B55_11435 [Blastocatellia bacterium]|nr:MAG: hypothetical protein C5B55_11435 [Blastocatellia bacterium]
MENLIAGIFGLLLGAVGLWTGFKQLKNRAAFAHWKTTIGKVVERGTYQPSVATGGPPAFRHAPLVKYSYRVNGQDFVNNAIHPIRIQLPQRNTLKWAQKKAASFPDEVTIHYNPEAPGESYLVLTSRWILYVVVASACVCLLVGVLFLLAYLM